MLPGFDVDAVEALNQIDLEDVVLVATPETDENPGLSPDPPNPRPDSAAGTRKQVPL